MLNLSEGLAPKPGIRNFPLSILCDKTITVEKVGSPSVRFSPTVALRKLYDAPNLPPSEFSKPSEDFPCADDAPLDISPVENILPETEATDGTEDGPTSRSMQRNQKRYSTACTANESFFKSKFIVALLPKTVEVPSLLLLPFPPNHIRLQEHVPPNSDWTQQIGSFFLAPVASQTGVQLPSKGVFVSNQAIDYMPPPLLAPATPTTIPAYFLTSARLIAETPEQTPAQSPFRYDGWDPMAAEHNASVIREGQSS
jgi:hypothetical protein